MIRTLSSFVTLGITVLGLALQSFANAQPIVVGSKRFTESYVLGEIVKRTLESAGQKSVQHKQGLGSTGIVWEALKTGAITVYPEYTGTVQEEILKAAGTLSLAQMRDRLKPFGVGMMEPLGFNNTYALVMRRDRAETLGIRKLSDLQSHPELVARPSLEFLKRKDGWEPLAKKYGFRINDLQGMEHTLGYAALRDGKIDLMDAYSTDAEIAEYDLKPLEDDLGYFPQYKAVLLYRLEIPASALSALRRLEGTITEALMIRLNAEARRTKDNIAAVNLYFRESTGDAGFVPEKSPSKLMQWTIQHLRLVIISLLFAMAFGIPLGIVASRKGWFGSVILGAVGVIQTIPSLALLALLVPILGITGNTAIVALFLYSLLPIVRNTATGLSDIQPSLIEAAVATGLHPSTILFRIKIPMASRTILAGVKTSAVINVGTATLAALIGAGGFGEPIVSGLALNDSSVILQGAVPAAILAVLVQLLFDGAEQILIPKGLRLKPGRN